jgi:maltose-binding protein MalE
MQNVKYLEIANDIRASIIKGIIRGVLPGVKNLTSKYNASQMTVNKAVNKLIEEGLIYRVPRKGSYVYEGIVDSFENLNVCVNEKIFSTEAMNVLSEKLHHNNDKTKISFIPVPILDPYDYFKYLHSRSRQKEKEALGVICVDDHLIPAYVENGLIESLDPIITKIKIDDFHPQLMDAFTYKNKLYGIPLVYDTKILFYNKDIFDELKVEYPNRSWTYKKLVDSARKLSIYDEKSKKQKYFGIHMGLGESLDYMPFIWEKGGNFFNANGTPSVKNISAIEGMQLYNDLVNTYRVYPRAPREMEYDYHLYLFKRKHLAMFIGRYRDLLALEKFSDINWGYELLPGHRKKTTPLMVQGLALAKKTPKRDKYFSLLEKITNDETLSDLAHTCQRLPAKKSLCPRDPKFFKEILSSSTLVPRTPFLEINKLEKNEIMHLATNIINAEECCQNIHDKINSFLASHSKKHSTQRS